MHSELTLQTIVMGKSSLKASIMIQETARSLSDWDFLIAFPAR